MHVQSVCIIFMMCSNTTNSDATFRVFVYYRYDIIFSLLSLQQRFTYNISVPLRFLSKLQISFSSILYYIVSLTCITLMGRLVSLANCSRMCLVGFGVCEKAVFSISSCLAFMVVLGPRLLDPELPSSGDLFSVWLSLVSGSPSKEPIGGETKRCIFIICIILYFEQYFI